MQASNHTQGGRKLKKAGLFVLLFSLTMCLALAGCSKSDSDTGANAGINATEDAENSVKEQVTIKLWSRWPESKPAFEQVVKDFMAKYPNIKVEMPSNAQTTQYITQLQAAISSNDLPDIFANSGAIPLDQFNQLGLLHNLDDLFPQGKKDEFYEGTWTEGFTMMDGHVYGVPHFTPRRYSHIMFYNKEVLKKAGLTEKDVPKTWDEFLAVSQKIKASDSEVYPLILGIKSDWLMSGVVGQMATAISPEVIPNNGLNLKKGQYEFNSQGYSETMKFIKKLQDNQYLHPNSLVTDFRQASSLFANNKAAFVFDAPFLTSDLKNNSKFNEFGVAPLPTKDGKPQYYAFQGETPATLYVSKNTKHYEEVKQFLNYYMDNFYVKQLELGIEGSPIMKQNETTKVDFQQFVEAQKIQANTFVLSPQPYTRNAAAIKVNTEMNSKKPKETIGKVLEGYLAGQVVDLDSFLTQLTGNFNAAFNESIKKVQDSGMKINLTDYQFTNWMPLEPYSTSKYDELKK